MRQEHDAGYKFGRFFEDSEDGEAGRHFDVEGGGGQFVLVDFVREQKNGENRRISAESPESGTPIFGHPRNGVPHEHQNEQRRVRFAVPRLHDAQRQRENRGQGRTSDVQHRRKKRERETHPQKQHRRKSRGPNHHHQQRRRLLLIWTTVPQLIRQSLQPQQRRHTQHQRKVPTHDRV